MQIQTHPPHHPFHPSRAPEPAQPAAPERSRWSALIQAFHRGESRDSLHSSWAAYLGLEPPRLSGVHELGRDQRLGEVSVDRAGGMTVRRSPEEQVGARPHGQHHHDAQDRHEPQARHDGPERRHHHDASGARGHCDRHGPHDRHPQREVEHPHDHCDPHARREGRHHGNQVQAAKGGEVGPGGLRIANGQVVLPDGTTLPFGNRGVIIRMPDGTQVAVGRNGDGPNAQACRWAVAGAGESIPTSPPGATNVYCWDGAGKLSLAGAI